MNLSQYLQNSSKKYLIFDFDETLFYLHLPWAIYFKQMRSKLVALDKSLESIDSLNQLENEAVKRFGAKALQIRQEYSQEFETNYLTGYSINQPLVDLVKQTNLSCFLWTSNMSETVLPILQKHQLKNTFQQMVTKSDVSLTKPEPEGFTRFIFQENTKKEEYLMIGDSSNDSGAAKKAGIDFFLIEYFHR